MPFGPPLPLIRIVSDLPRQCPFPAIYPSLLIPFTPLYTCSEIEAIKVSPLSYNNKIRRTPDFNKCNITAYLFF